MSEQISEFLKNNPTLLTNPSSIKLFPIKDSINLSQSYQSLKENSDFVELMIESLSVSNRYKKNKISFNNLKEGLLNQTQVWVTDIELKKIENDFFNINKTISETEINDTILWAEIEKIRKEELSIFLTNSKCQEIEIFLNDDFKKKNQTLSLFLKKKALDHVSLEMFGQVNSKFNQLFSVSKITQNHILNEDKSLPQNEIIFAYINMNRMEAPKTPRFGSIFDPYEVKHHKVNNVYHKQIKSRVEFMVNDKKIIINCDIWIGNITCECEEM